MKKQAIGVGRFSSEAQEGGDSRIRQQRAFERVCRTMDLEVVGYLFDNGKSAYKGEHLRADSEFGAFLMRVRAGGVKPCLLVWEMVDRFSRMGGRKTTGVAEELVNAGFSLYFEDEELLIDATNIDDKWGELQKHLEASFKFSRRLSKRMSGSWERKREAGKDAVNRSVDKGTKSKVCPKWLTPKGAEYVENSFADVVREMFRLALEGHGADTIIRMMKVEEVDVHGYLRNRAVIGEKRTLRGKEPAIPGYYPPIITEDVFFRVGAGLDKRRVARGRKGTAVTNLFTELVYGSDGKKMFIKVEVDGRRVLLRRTPGRHRTWYYPALESAILLELRDVELVPAAALSKDYGAILADLAKQITFLTELQSEFPSRANAIALASLEKKVEEVVAEQEEEKGRVAPPVALTECKTLLGQLAAVTGDELRLVRTRISACVARLLTRIDCDIRESIHGTTECSVRLTFVDGSVRVFGIENVGRKTARYMYTGLCGVDGRPGGDSCQSSAEVGATAVDVTDYSWAV